MVDEKIAKLPIIVVIGGAGSGKATACLRLEKEFNLANVNTGGLLRAAVSSGSPKGKEISDCMASGQLVCQGVVVDIIKDYVLKHADNVKGVLFVGYPRDVAQAQALEAEFGSPKLVLHYFCDDGVRKQRLLAAHAHADDNEATIDARLKAYHAHSADVVKHYGDKVKHIDANKDEASVYAASVEAIKSIGL